MGDIAMDGLQTALTRAADAVSALLEEMLPVMAGLQGTAVEAMRYGALGGGKRLRPFLLVESARIFDVPEERALRAGAALEMIHCYSLIHDDLPAMDDSALRRGRPTAHKRFGEAIAILAGDGLLTEAFTVLADPRCHPDARVRIELVAGLARAAGVRGMVGGQTIDISPARAGLDLAGITELQGLKTGALITFSCEGGAILGRAGAEERAALVNYAADLGLAFQIVDDLLDAEGSAEELGKPTGQDATMGKATFVGQLGLDGARSKAAEIVDRARARLDLFGEKADLLEKVALFVLERKK